MNNQRLLVLTGLFLCAFTLCAQSDDDYRPFIEEGKVWTLANPQGLPNTHRRNYFDGDTVIAGKRCKRWIQEDAALYSQEMVEYVLYAYEENKRVWFFQEGDTVPRLFFNFAADIGDTLVVQLAYAKAFAAALNWAKQQSSDKDGFKQYEETFTDTLIITQKGVREYGEHMQKCIWFNHIENGQEQSSHWDFMMEGVGTLTAPYWNFPSLTGFDLLTCTSDDVVLFWEANAEYWGVQRPSCIYSSQIVNGKSVNRKCYDLTGRRLAAPPAKGGMYIENGKKWVAK